MGQGLIWPVPQQMCAASTATDGTLMQCECSPGWDLFARAGLRLAEPQMAPDASRAMQ